ncbi:MAG: glycoside hydrolase family 3 protein [Bdellovibrionales bacterium]|nr:glycoside hydrolase family 3 protein [Bdellovibrionales bacterium]
MRRLKIALLFCMTLISAELRGEGSSISDLEIGQLLLIGFKGHSIDEGLQTAIQAFHPGGVLLFGRNVQTVYQVAELTHAAQRLSLAHSKKPLLIAIDQEGGNVIRLRHAPPLPSALAIAQTKNPQIAEKAGRATGTLLRTLGINTNLAPVVDVSDPSTDTFLGTRSFGNDPGLVAKLSSHFALGLQAERVMPIAKHFPGHGDASGDSHFVAASSPLTRDEVMSKDLAPYLALSAALEKPWGIMLAHVSFPKIDPSKMPATFSSVIVQGLLRKELGDDVLVVTDDIEMAGASSESDIGNRSVRAIEAGADMVMIAWSLKVQKQVFSAIRKAIDTGRLKPERIRQSLRRIELAKSRYTTGDYKLPTVTKLKDAMKNPLFAEVGDSVLTAFVSANSGRTPASISTIEKSDEAVLLLSPRLDFIKSFRSAATGFQIRAVHLTPTQIAHVEREIHAHPHPKIVAYASGPQAVKFISKLDDGVKSRVHLVSVETSAMIPDADKFLSVLQPYYRHPQLGRAIASLILERETSSSHL